MFIRAEHNRAGSLLDCAGRRSRKAGQREDVTPDCLGRAIIISHLIRRIDSSAGRSDIGDQLSCFQVIAAESPLLQIITADVRHIEVIPEAAHSVRIHIHGYTSVFTGINGMSELMTSNENIICEGIAPKEGLAVIGCLRLCIGPFIICFCCLSKSLPGGKLLQ